MRCVIFLLLASFSDGYGFLRVREGRSGKRVFDVDDNGDGVLTLAEIVNQAPLRFSISEAGDQDESPEDSSETDDRQDDSQISSPEQRVADDGDDTSEGQALPAGDDESPEHSNIHVACKVAGQDVDMLVDSGASVSIISQPLARQLGLLSRLDDTEQSEVTGIGHANILGRLSDIPVKLGNVESAMTFDVLDTDESLLLFGSDHLRHFKCIVDFERGCLLFGGHSGVEIPFLESPTQPVS